MYYLLFVTVAFLFSSISSPPKLPVVVSGVVTKGDKDFTPAAAQVAHQKPVPAVQKLPAAHHINQHINQPRKWALYNSRPPRPPCTGPGPHHPKHLLRLPGISCRQAFRTPPSTFRLCLQVSCFHQYHDTCSSSCFLPVDHCNTKIESSIANRWSETC